jgi:hypothetical protein
MKAIKKDKGLLPMERYQALRKAITETDFDIPGARKALLNLVTMFEHLAVAEIRRYGKITELRRGAENSWVIEAVFKETKPLKLAKR